MTLGDPPLVIRGDLSLVTRDDPSLVRRDPSLVRRDPCLVGRRDDDLEKRSTTISLSTVNIGEWGFIEAR